MTHAAIKLCIATVLATALTLGLFSLAWAQDVPRMDKDTLRSRLDDPGLVIVDVRSSSDWKGSQYKLPGAVRIEPDDTEDLVAEYLPEMEYVFYCA